MSKGRPPILAKGDIDGFFGLAIDNLVQLLLIVLLCENLCGMKGADAGFLFELILPGVAVSLVIGNLFYALQAHWVAYREGRSDVTALPYGINTPSLLVYMYFVMAPAYRAEGAEYAWKLGLVACLGSGIIEFAGAFVAERVRRNTPRAALLSTLSGIAIAFISMTFALQIWQRPLVAMVPMAVVLLVFFAKVRFPLGLPGGLVAVLLGTGLAWLLSGLEAFGVQPISPVNMDPSAVQQAWNSTAWHLPQWCGPQVWDALHLKTADLFRLISVIIPMGLFNVVGSLQNIESAEASGDVFPTGPSLAVNGLGTIAAALFGSCFPTTIYIGHPGWKGLGARASYSTLNAVFMTLICLTGTVSLIGKVVPIEAGIAIVLWIGIVITAQAFQATPVRHAPAVAIGLFPAIAAWGATILTTAFINADPNMTPLHAEAATQAVAETQPSTTTQEVAGASDAVTTQPAGASAPSAHAASETQTDETPTKSPPTPGSNTLQDLLLSERASLGIDTEVGGFLVHGMIVLERGFIFTCMIIAAISAFLIDRRFKAAAIWSLAAALLTAAGMVHAYSLQGNVVDYLPLFITAPDGAIAYRAWDIAIGYLLMALLFGILTLGGSKSDRGDTGDPLEDARVVEDDLPEVS